MSRYTAEDFKNARFAEHPDGRLAMRDLDLDYRPWSVSGSNTRVARSDDGLAAAGWRPVHEHVPQPEPWQDLADLIEEAKWEIDRSDPAALARWLYERGVRMEGGDDA